MRRLVTLLLAALTVAHAAKIEHFIVIMMENRSFDHMCGWLNRNNSDINGLTGSEFNIANGTKYFVADTCPYVNPFDPNHDFDDTTRQIMGSMTGYETPAPMSGFARDHFLSGYPEYWNVMTGFGPERVPAISTLAMEYAVFDQYYASLPGPTIPNRLFIHSGTTDGTVHGDDVDLAEGWPQRTIYDVLDNANMSWAAYYGDISDLLYMRSPRMPRNIVNLHPFDDFYTHAAEGTLPTYTWLSPQFYPSLSKPAMDQHPDHDVVDGEELLASVYAAVRSSPLWEKTALFITYDEHGGFYDHVPPPVGCPNPDGKNATDDFLPFNFTRMGIRVCSVLVSPFVKKGTVVHEAPEAQYEHTSIYRTIQNLFGFAEPPLTKRQAWAAPFDDILSLSEPRTDCPMTVPTPPNTAERREAVHAEQRKRKPNGLQKELYRLVEGLHGRDGKDVDRFASQEEMGDHVRHYHELFVQQQKTQHHAGGSEKQEGATINGGKTGKGERAAQQQRQHRPGRPPKTAFDTSGNHLRAVAHCNFVCASGLGEKTT
jgi:phospholipase C